jgi:hypothetical protein
VYIEVKVTHNAATGTVTVKATDTLNNQEEVLAVTGANTGADSDTIHLCGGTSENATVDIDDVVINDASGSANNDFPGNTQVEARFPSAVGAHAEFTPAGAAANWDCVNDVVPDDTATYVTSQAASVKDVHQTQNAQLSNGVVKGLQTLIYAAKTGSTTFQIQRIIRPGSTNHFGPIQHNIQSVYDYYREISEENPDTSNPWTLSEFNAAQFGYGGDMGPPVIPDYIWHQGLKITEAGNEGLSDGQAIQLWYDSTGNSRHADNTVGGDNPNFIESYLNGKGGVQFGAGDKLPYRWTGGPPIDIELPAWTLYMVFEITNTYIFQGAIYQVRGSGGSDKGMCFGYREDFGSYHWWLANTTGGVVDTKAQSAAQASPPRGPLIICAKSTLGLWVDGVSVPLTVGQGPNPSSDRGINPDGHVPLKIAEILVYMTPHDSNTQTGTENYLRSRYGL